jgi:hypothetical protein
MFCFSSLSEYHTVSLFRVTELVLGFAEVMGVKKCVDYTQRFQGICPVTAAEEERADATCPDPVGFQKYRRPS